MGKKLLEIMADKTRFKHYNKYMEDEISKIDTSFEPFCNGFGNSDVKSA